MGHHGQDGFGELPEELREKIAELQQAFAGDYPLGKMNRDDQGALAVATTADKGRVILAFPKPTDWVGFGPEQARDLAEMMLERAEQCDGIEAHVRKVSTEKTG
jgi:hypothetical protein